MPHAEQELLFIDAVMATKTKNRPLILQMAARNFLALDLCPNVSLLRGEYVEQLCGATTEGEIAIYAINLAQRIALNQLADARQTGAETTIVLNLIALPNDFGARQAFLLIGVTQVEMRKVA